MSVKLNRNGTEEYLKFKLKAKDKQLSSVGVVRGKRALKTLTMTSKLE